MNREEYMKQLAYLLQDLPDNEREEALSYYEDYFDDAGNSEESNVIFTLGSPERVAAMIKDGLTEQNESAGEYTDSGYADDRFRENYKVPEPRMQEENKGYENHSQQDRGEGGYSHYYQGQYQRGQYQQERYERDSYEKEYGRENLKNGNKLGKIILIGIVCVFAIPVIFPLIGGAVGLFFGLLGGLLGILFGALGVAGGLSISGIVCIGTGIAKMFVSAPIGILTIGSGMILLAVGILCFILGGWIAAKLIPKFFRLITDLLGRILRRGRRTNE